MNFIQTDSAKKTLIHIESASAVISLLASIGARASLRNSTELHRLAFATGAMCAVCAIIQLAQIWRESPGGLEKAR